MRPTFPAPARLARATIFGLAGLFLLPACVALVPYSPNPARFAEQKPEDLKKTFAEVVTRSQEPRYTSGEITDDFFKCDGVQVMMGAWYTTTSIPFVRQVYFNNLTKIEIYENNKVWVYDSSGGRAFESQFASRDDCLLLVDIIEYFRAKKAAAK